MRVYLDNCCFNRPFDDQTALTIRLETEAKLHIQDAVHAGRFALGWSYVLDYENAANPLEGRLVSSNFRHFIESHLEQPQGAKNLHFCTRFNGIKGNSSSLRSSE